MPRRLSQSKPFNSLRQDSSSDSPFTRSKKSIVEEAQQIDKQIDKLNSKIQDLNFDNEEPQPGERKRRFSLKDTQEKLHKLQEEGFNKLKFHTRSLAQKLATHKETLNQKKERLISLLIKPEVTRLIDKISFVVGILFLLVNEYFLLVKTHYMWLWYLGVITPLLLLRYYTYRKSKYHYFLLDFCYFVNFLLIFYLLYYPNAALLFKIVYTLSTGPLLFAIIAWRNSFVFHSLDKMTSVLIHIFPPLVTYCLRWYPVPPGSDIQICEHKSDSNDCSLTFYETFLSLFVYIFWQICYYLMTEVVEKVKLQQDRTIMTSLRWMVEKQPHPIYVFFLRHGYQGDPIVLLIGCQLIYTILLILPMPFFFSSYIAHTCYFSIVFVWALWNGATFYFEIFTSQYFKRLKELEKEKKEKQRELKLKMKMENPQDNLESSESSDEDEDSEPEEGSYC